jgi:hypothetical protein
MAQRGRKSAALLSIESVLGNERPAPPDELTEEEAEEWRAIAGRMPHDWFTRENHPLLAEYCRHIVRARDLAQDIAKFKRFPSEVRRRGKIPRRLSATLEPMTNLDHFCLDGPRLRGAAVGFAMVGLRPKPIRRASSERCAA